MTPIKKIAIPAWMSDPDAAAVFAALQDVSDPQPAVLFVGGCVRDALMRRPVGDVDMATVHPPDIVTARLRAAGIDVLEIGIEHGTVVAQFGTKLFQITTLRVDVETDGRRATVAYTDDWAEDASRRDFTFNALFADREGQIFDPIGGLSDLQARQVRFIGDPGARIAEDALRILRFFRFYAQIKDSKLDPDGLEACGVHAGDVANLSGERIRQELFKLLSGTNAPAGLYMAIQSGAIAAALPDLRNLETYPHESYIYCLSAIEADYDQVDPLRRLALLVDHRDIAAAVSRRLHLSNRESQRLTRMAERHVIHPTLEARVRFRAPPEKPPDEAAEKTWREQDMLGLLLPSGVESWLRRREARRRDRLLNHLSDAQRVKLYELGPDAWRDAVILSWAIIWAEEHSMSPEAWAAVLDAPVRDPIPEFPLGGADVLDAGVPQGPDVSRFLKVVEDWWVAGGFAADRAACLAELRKHIAAD